MTKNHGGKRQGAGRPPLTEGEPTRGITVTLTERDIEFLERVGKDNRSEGVRQAVALLRKQEEEAAILEAAVIYNNDYREYVRYEERQVEESA